MNNKRLSELRYKGYITDSEYKELKLALKERPMGHWIKDCDSCDCSNCYDSGARFTRKDCSGRCSNCGELQCCTDNFCPNCGAIMRERGR